MVYLRKSLSQKAHIRDKIRFSTYLEQNDIKMHIQPIEACRHETF